MHFCEKVFWYYTTTYAFRITELLVPSFFCVTLYVNEEKIGGYIQAEKEKKNISLHFTY